MQLLMTSAVSKVPAIYWILTPMIPGLAAGKLITNKAPELEIEENEDTTKQVFLTDTEFIVETI